MTPPSAANVGARGPGMAPFVRETLRGVTWTRAGIFLFFCAWMSFGSFPTANAALAGDIRGVLRAWTTWTFGHALCYGPPALVLLAVTNRLSTITWKSMAAVAATVLAGSAFYASIVYLVHYMPRGREFNATAFASILLEGAVEIGVVSLLFVLLAHRDRSTDALRQAEFDRIALDRELAEARVMALQSQIEPHFLFNTLANVRRLLATDRAAGRLMVRQLSQYLHSSLSKLRDAKSSLGRELALTTAYLSVQQVRMGDRLEVAVDVPARLAAASFPPMMLITLVENAIKHGLAPIPEGGRVSIAASESDGRLLVRVVDTGAGIKSMSGAGIGIANTRARLQALFGADGRLRIGNNDAAGVTAAIEIPFAISEAS
jgi:signal transduction histidine kinase